MPIYLLDKNGWVNIDAQDPWTKLFGGPDVKGPGTVTMEKGTFDMVRRSS